MVFEPLVDAGKWVIALVPTSWRPGKPKINFIECHYLYMIGLTVISSILLYPAGGLAYIDAFFFAAGAATQSGLNPVNVNDLCTYQQVVLMLIACIANPVFINTIVVFVRLYWFEKRFEHLVKDIRNQRRSRTRSFSRTFSKGGSKAKSEHDLSNLERGVNGRKIRVLHETTKPNGMNGSNAVDHHAQTEFAEKLGLDTSSEDVFATPPGGSNHGSDRDHEVPPDGAASEERAQVPETPQTPGTTYLGLNPRIHREITFADEVDGSPNAQALPQAEDAPEGTELSRHIHFLERQQRNALKEGGTLRIPGPRDFDRGEKPKELEDSDDEELKRPQTRNTLQTVHSEKERASKHSDGRSEEINADDHPRRGITIDAPEHPGHHTRDSGDLDRERNATVSSRFGINRITSHLHLRRSRSKGGLSLKTARRSMSRTNGSLSTARSLERAGETMPYLSWQATIGRNSAFLGLTEEQREELGGIEYRSLKTLAKTLILYFVGFHVLGMVVLLPWITHVAYWKSLVESGGVSAAWWGVFTPASMFNDLGFTLTPDSMNSFQNATLPLLFGSFLIIIGNTGFPCMLRFVIWVCASIVPAGSQLWEELRFLLDHPRRCFTLLFPSRASWWLFWVLVLLNGIDLIFFIILDLDDPTVTSIPAGYRVLSGWFQATSTRTAGFSCVNLAGLHPAIQVSYLIMMYISVFPIAISVRRTNVYEEKSLGIWGGEEEHEGGDPSYVGQHLRRQLSFDLWYLFLGFFIICIVEGPRLQDTNEYAFTMFSVLFEIVSAYGTVGLSLGYPNVDTSFSSQFAVISKLVIVAMMIRGRHRGLPYALDRAILLPSENLHRKEAEEADRRHQGRRGSVLEQTGPWEGGDVDDSGLPRQHTGADEDPMTAGAGGEHSPENMRVPRRRSSGLTINSRDGRRPHTRARSIGTIIAGGLSAGPTVSKSD